MCDCYCCVCFAVSVLYSEPFYTVLIFQHFHLYSVCPLLRVCENCTHTHTHTHTGDGKSSVIVTFFSSVIVDASHPSCKIQWNYSYLEPTSEDSNRSLLPGCFNAESREGYHMTYYWFHILDWAIY